MLRNDYQLINIFSPPFSQIGLLLQDLQGDPGLSNCLNLYKKGIPSPDLLIRTGNTQRLSNFLLWQSAYTEIFFEKKLWPDFKKNDYKKIINKFRSLKRNFGAI